MPYVASQRCIRQHYSKADMSLPVSIHSAKRGADRLPADVDILRVIGYLQLQHGKFEQSIVLFDALHALFPEDLNIGLSLAFALLQSGHAHESSEVLQQIESCTVFSDGLSSPQKDPCFCWLRSQALTAAGQTIEAARWMRFFLRLRRQSNLQAAS
jgi:hypothetical protein